MSKTKQKTVQKLEKIQAALDQGKIGKALKEIRDITEHNFRKSVTLQSIEDRNLGVVAWLLAQAALNRHESRGTHELEEYPFRDDANWLKHIEFHESELILVDHINV